MSRGPISFGFVTRERKYMRPSGVLACLLSIADVIPTKATSPPLRAARARRGNFVCTFLIRTACRNGSLIAIGPSFGPVSIALPKHECTRRLSCSRESLPLMVRVAQRTSWIFEKQNPCSRRAYPVQYPYQSTQFMGPAWAAQCALGIQASFAATFSDSTRTPKDLTCAPFGVRSKEALVPVTTTPTCTASFYFIIIIYISISIRDGPTRIHHNRRCQVKNKPPVALVGVM